MTFPLEDAGRWQRPLSKLRSWPAEAGQKQLPVLSGLHFGHTQPMLTLSYGARARIDCVAGSLTVLDAGVC